MSPIPLPDDDDETPDLFEPAPGPAPVQYDLFTEEELQELAPTMDSLSED
ncbi:hypothetical protein QFA96_12290 [Pseudomonas sp. Ap32]|nr:hypothetical protein QFA96_12290 [Pseudomonas sp. Ap32]